MADEIDQAKKAAFSTAVNSIIDRDPNSTQRMNDAINNHGIAVNEILQGVAALQNALLQGTEPDDIVAQFRNKIKNGQIEMAQSYIDETEISGDFLSNP